MKTNPFILMASLLLFSCSGLPKPEFTIIPEENPEAGDSIRFMNESRNAARFEWEFGDGAISNVTHPVYVYQVAGVYEVSLTALNDAGSNLIIEPITIYEPTILGFVVYDSTQTRLLTGALVWVYDNEADRDSLETPLYEGITDAAGKVEFHNLEQEVYHVWASKDESGGSWTYKGYTFPLQQNKVNFYTIPCSWFPNQE
ncbi:MAG: PKD domain-containing protein [Bacteroidota bacterium]